MEKKVLTEEKAGKYALLMSLLLENDREAVFRALDEARTPAFSQDGRVLPGENGLIIAALCRAYRMSGDAACLRQAHSARIFLKTRLETPEGRLLGSWKDRKASGEGTLADYAGYLLGLLELYAASFSSSVLREAVGLADRMAEGVPEGEEGLALAALTLSRLGQLTGRTAYRRAAEQYLLRLPADRPMDAAQALAAKLVMRELLREPGELVCTAAQADRMDAPELPGIRMLVKTPDNERALKRLAPFTEHCPIPAGGTAYYLCRDGVCGRAIPNVEKLRESLGQ